MIRNGSSHGSGSALGNVKDGVVRNGSSPGSGSTVGKGSHYAIKGMKRELEGEMVAAHHFLVKKML